MDTNEQSLIVSAKSGNKAAKLQLWNNYQRMLHKHAFIYSWTFPRDFEEDDFIQECWFAFEKAIEYFNLEKYPNISFQTVFHWYVGKVEAALKNSIAKKPAPLSLDIFESVDGNSMMSSLGARNISKISIDFDETMETANLRNVLNKLLDKYTGTERKALELYSDSISMAEVARRLNCDYDSVYYLVHDAKKVAKQLYQRIAI